MYSLVDCAEEHAVEDSSYDINTGEINASATLRCSYANRHALVHDILVNRRAWPKGSDLINPPLAFSASIKPAKGQYVSLGQEAYYEDAIVAVKYSTKTPDLYSEEIEPTTQFLKMDHKLFRWSSATGDPLLENEAPGRLVRGMNLVRTLFRVDPPLPATLLTLPGCVNNATYASSTLGLTFAAETLLFGQPKLSRTIKADGSGWQFKITLRFTYNDAGWNKYWRAKTQTYERIWTAGTSGAQYYNYPLADFSYFLF